MTLFRGSFSEASAPFFAFGGIFGAGSLVLAYQVLLLYRRLKIRQSEIENIPSGCKADLRFQFVQRRIMLLAMFVPFLVLSSIEQFLWANVTSHISKDTGHEIAVTFVFAIVSRTMHTCMFFALRMMSISMWLRTAYTLANKVATVMSVRAFSFGIIGSHIAVMSIAGGLACQAAFVTYNDPPSVDQLLNLDAWASASSAINSSWALFAVIPCVVGRLSKSFSSVNSLRASSQAGIKFALRQLVVSQSVAVASIVSFGIQLTIYFIVLSRGDSAVFNNARVALGTEASRVSWLVEVIFSQIVVVGLIAWSSGSAAEYELHEFDVATGRARWLASTRPKSRGASSTHAGKHRPDVVTRVLPASEAAKLQLFSRQSSFDSTPGILDL